MASGKRTWSQWDTRLHFACETVKAMQIAELETRPLQKGERGGASIDVLPHVKMPESAWHGIAEPMRMLAAASQLRTTVDVEYYDETGVVRVTFTRRRGD